MKERIRIFEGFAGYGGASFGLKRLKENMPEIEYEVIGYSEFDKFASKLFDANHKDANGKPFKNWGDITQINPNELPDFDMFMGGFPCQPFSSAGMQMGTEDPYGRGAMLGYIIRICKVKKPKYLFLENVKGFTHGKFQPIHNQLVKDLREMGYGENPLHKAVLNSKDYGIPQNRERLWMFAQMGGLPRRAMEAPWGHIDTGFCLFICHSRRTVIHSHHCTTYSRYRVSIEIAYRFRKGDGLLHERNIRKESFDRKICAVHILHMHLNLLAA